MALIEQDGIESIASRGQRVFADVSLYGDQQAVRRQSSVIFLQL